MRGIDKKATLTIEQRPNPTNPGVIVRIAHDKRTGTLEISETALLASRTDLMQRNRVRTALKRTRDRLMEETTPIFSTKTQNQKPEGNSWFRPSQNRGR
ncbi:MAG TPA: hypothetical protein VMW56_25080 [Candidatus Margulisiibacteriota bacterium]|nr:hypothetical protein [Candidatus Margulisiibacteriota bacterium]